MNEKKAAALIGMATKAGRTVSGEDTVLNSIRSGEAALVIVSAEASDRSRKTFSDKCGSYGVPLIIWGTKEELGKHLGKATRTVAAVTDEGFGKKIEQLFREGS